MKKIIILLFLIMCINKAYAQGQLKFNSTSIDFGTIDKSEPFLRATFSFCNIGNAPIEIDKTVASTSDIRTEYPKVYIQPNEKGEIKVEYFIQSSYPGRFRKTIKIITSNQDAINLQIAGNISDNPPAKQKRLEDGITWYRIYNEGKYGALNSEERQIIKPDYISLFYSLDNFVGIKKDSVFLFNSEGKQFRDIKCTYFEEFHGVYKAQNNNKYFALFDKKGKSLIPFERMYLLIDKEEHKDLGNYYYVKTNNYWALCNSSGDEVFRFNKPFKPYYKKERFVIRTSDESQEGEHIIVHTFYDINGKNLGYVKGDKSLIVTVDDNGDIIYYDVLSIALFKSDSNKYKEITGSDSPIKVIGNIQQLTTTSKNPLEE